MPAYSNDPQKLQEFALDAARQYGYGSDVDVSLLNLSENATFKIEDGTATSILRIHRPSYHTPLAIKSELNWIDALRNSDLVSTPAILTAKNGNDGLALGSAELEVLDRLVDTLTRRLNKFGNGKDRFGLVHADMRLANLLVDGPNVSVIDFDDCGMSWFMYDLGSSVSFIEDSPLIPAMVDSWVEGYCKVAPLSQEEVNELQTFIMFRRLLLVSWVGTHQDTETGQEMGENFTKVTCDLAENYLSTFA